MIAGFEPRLFEGSRKSARDGYSMCRIEILVCGKNVACLF